MKVTFSVGAPRPVTTLVSYAFVGVLFGVATAVVWNALKLIATIPLPGGVNAVLIGIVLWLLVMAVLYWLSANYEDLSARGRFTGQGCAIVSASGCARRFFADRLWRRQSERAGFLTSPVGGYSSLSSLGLVICAVTHLSDNDLYGYEEDGEPRVKQRQPD